MTGNEKRKKRLEMLQVLEHLDIKKYNLECEIQKIVSEIKKLNPTKNELSKFEFDEEYF